MPELIVPPREHLDLLYQASLEFNSTLELDELLPRVFNRAIEVLDAEAGAIWLRYGDTLVCRLATGSAGATIVGLEAPVGAGIVGYVAHAGEPELILDAREDPRFLPQVDEQAGSVTRSMLAAPIEAKSDVLGVLQLMNKRGGTGLFDETDLALLEGLALIAGMALRNVQLHGAERRAHDLRALLGISREITSTLDVTRLALTVVNLSSQALTYDRAAMALEENGRLALAAISGQEALGANREDEQELTRLIAWLAERNELAYVPDITDPDDELASALRAGFPAYWERSGTCSLCLAPLKDDEGRLGALYLESSRSGFLEGGGVEATELLANQTSVALRNATLYTQVPFIGVLEPVAAWWRRLARLPRAKLLRRLAVPAAVILALVVIPWRERIKPLESQLLPGVRTPVRAMVEGLITETRVREGDEVEPGRVLAVLRDDPIRLQIQEATAALAVAERQAAAARARGDQAAEQVAGLQARELQGRLRLLAEQLERTRLRAPAAGVVLTPRPEERLGDWLQAGETFVVLGRTDRLEVDSHVSQQDVERVRTGQPIRVRVPARPEYTFVGTVTHIAAHADSAGVDGEPTFVVRSALDNTRGLLRPGMEARAKIVGGLRPVGYVLIRPFVHWIQLRFWR